ncbi:HD domain-containing protein, partial [Candidatus Daviesbacteria bacterium]|nr:HD domain-containing protein [Candidatus Daviesbacteria bacterium]
PEKVLKMGLFHDIGETIVGDVGTFVKGMAGGVFKNIEEEGVKALVDGLDSKTEIIGLIEEYNERKSVEARLVKASDNLDALAQAKSVPGAQSALKYFKKVYHITKFDWHKKAVDMILSGDIEPGRDWQKK